MFRINRFSLIFLFLSIYQVQALKLPRLNFPRMNLKMPNLYYPRLGGVYNRFVMPPLRKIGEGLEATYDFFGIENLGTQSLALENEIFVRNILKEMGIKRKVCIRRFSQLGIHLGFYKNACAVDFGTITYMFIDEEWFDTLSGEEKRFLIGHESAHLAHWHEPIEKIITACLLKKLADYIVKRISGDISSLNLKLVLDTNDFDKLLAQVVEKVKKNVPFVEKHLPVPAKEKDLFGFNLPFSLLSLMFLRGYVSRFCEMDADSHAARKLGAVEGGIKLTHRFKSEEDPPSRFAIKRGINTIFRGLKSLFATHPADEVRIANLEKIRREQQLKEREDELAGGI